MQAKLTLSFAQSRRRNEMKCHRCGNDKEAEFRVVSDILDIKVCADCAGEARSLGMSVEVVEIDKAKNERAVSNAEAARGYRVVMVSDYAH
jgi:predicted metal-binding protein